MPLHHDIVSRCCDCFNCPLPVTTLIWGTVIKMKRWSFIVTTSSVTLLLFWRCKRFFKNSHSKYNCTRASLVRISCLFVRHSYLWEFCGFEHDTNVLYDTRVEQENNLTPDGIRKRVPQYWMISYAPDGKSVNIHCTARFLIVLVSIPFYEKGKWIFSQPHHFSNFQIQIFHQFGQIFVKISIWMF